MEPWDLQLIRRQSAATMVGIARHGRLLRLRQGAASRVDLSWVDESALAMIDAAVAQEENITLVYPAPAGEVSVLIAAQLLIGRLIQGARSTSVGIVTADTTQATRTWGQLRFGAPGDNVAISEVFPCYRSEPDGTTALPRGFKGLLVGQRFQQWPVDVVIVDHLAGAVTASPCVPTVDLVADPLDPVLGRLAAADIPIWGWSGTALSTWNEEVEHRAANTIPFSVTHERLATMSAGVRVTVTALPHPAAEAAGKRIRGGLRRLRHVAGPVPNRAMARGIRVAWHHFSTLTSLPCAPARFDRHAGTPPWAAPATATFEDELRAWAATLDGEAADIVSALASDLGELRFALDEGHPAQQHLARLAEDGPATLVVLRTRTAQRALVECLGGNASDDEVGALRFTTMSRLHLEGTCDHAVVVGVPARWDLHRLDSGLSPDVTILALGTDDAATARSGITALQAARRHWGGHDQRARAWRRLIGGDPPPAAAEPDLGRSAVELATGRAFVSVPDPFDALEDLLVAEPLFFADEGPRESLASRSGSGHWSGVAEAVEVITDDGRIRLERARVVDVRDGSEIRECRADELQVGMRLLVGRRPGRLGLLEALEDRLESRADLLAARLLIDDYQTEVRSAFMASGLSLTQLRRRLIALGCQKTFPAVRSWVVGHSIMAPRDFEDLERLNQVLGLGYGDRRLREIFAAVRRRRNFRRAAGRVLAGAARAATTVTEDRIDPDTGLSIADLRDAVVEAVVRAVVLLPDPIPLADLGHLEDA